MRSFDGLAKVYEQSRLGYPHELCEHLVAGRVLAARSTVVDLGAGTGQLARLAAEVAAVVIAVDPEPDMIREGQELTRDLPAVRWILGADHDLRQLIAEPVDAVLIGNAFHHMDQPALLADLDRLVTPSGAVVVCSTSVPVWLQDTDWSRALRTQLSKELGRAVGSGGTPDHEADMSILRSSAFADVAAWVYERHHMRHVDSIVGEVVSSASGAIDRAAAERLAIALEPFVADHAVPEQVRTTALIARR